MSQKKTCKQCVQEFVVEDEDLAFYKKISPTFAGKTFEIPAPTLCPICRDIRRYTWRNERTLYRRKSAKTGKEIISMYAPDSEFVVWSIEEWHSDDWNPMDFGCDWDPSQPFFKQFYDFIKPIPRPPITLFNDEGCDFCNFVWDCKNCYLCFAMMESEDCMYSWRAFRSESCLDCNDTKDSQYCYQCLNSTNLYKCQNCERCLDCRDSYFNFDCRGCANIFMCVGLRKKQYYIRNKQYSKDEYFDALKNENLNLRSARKKLAVELEELKSKFIRPENFSFKCENCTGDYMEECKNCTDCYSIKNSEGSKHIQLGNQKINNSMDLSQVVNCDYCYETTSASGYKNIFCHWPMYGDNNLYLNFCEACSNCFGCFGLKHKEYCIFNKQYTKDEYEILVSKIIEKMIKDSEWGELFPSWTSPFTYNESMANLYYPKSKEGALKIGAKWQERDFGPKYEGESYEPKDDIREYIKSEEERQNILKGVLKCEESGRAYKILPQELAFYIENEVPIPSKHYDIRLKEALKLVNPRQLYHRKCMCEESGHNHQGICANEFDTTYAPDRPEKIYCEECYQKSVI